MEAESKWWDVSKTQPAIAALKMQGGHEPKNGAKSLETEKGKEKGYLQESLEGNVAMLTPWF